MASSSQRYFTGGMDSYTAPDQLAHGEYVFGTNIVNRGGIPQTRPGSVAHACLPSGSVQGLTIYTPPTGTAHLVAAVDGVIYVAPAPFNVWTRLAGIQFSASAKYVAWAVCQKSTDYTPDGVLYYHDPYDVLVMSDGRTRTAFWDGGEARHLNPTPSGGEATQVGYDETKIGLWMAWSNNRLWISRGGQVFASDVGNPLKFTESQYLNEAPAFYLPSKCMGLLDVPEMNGLLAFHQTGVDFIESSIANRTEWLQTPNMQRTVIHIGCVAPRSIIKQYGFVYWFSPAGLVSIDDAYRTNQSNRLDVQDQEMAWSKAYIGPDLSGMAGVAYENYMLLSVPWCNVYNKHTWCLDQAVFEGRAPAWNSVWTGWRPVEWVTGTVDGRDRVFFISKDLDDVNRVWEAFTSDRKDNGCDITCSCVLNMEWMGSQSVKKYGYAEIDVAQLDGDVSVMAAVKGWKGYWERVLTKEIVATHNRLDSTLSLDGAFMLGSNHKQFRTIRTKDWSLSGDHNELQVEADTWPRQVQFDRAFQLMLAWSGRAGVLGLRQFAKDEPDKNDATCEDNEMGPRHVTTTGKSGTLEDPEDIADDPFPLYSSTYTATLEVEREGYVYEYSSTKTATSKISQADADRKAQCMANGQVALIYPLSELATYIEPRTWITFLTQ